MTVALNQSSVLPYVGNNTQSVFPITFPTFENDTIQAMVVLDSTGASTALSLTTDYTLASVGIPRTNASLTLVSAGQAWLNTGKLKTGYTLKIKFKADGYQPTPGRDWGAFTPELFVRTLDRFGMSVNALRDRLLETESDVVDITAELALIQTNLDTIEASVLALTFSDYKYYGASASINSWREGKNGSGNFVREYWDGSSWINKYTETPSVS